VFFCVEFPARSFHHFFFSHSSLLSFGARCQLSRRVFFQPFLAIQVPAVGWVVPILPGVDSRLTSSFAFELGAPL